ncbi:MAG: low-specificity L-threonine aldolase [Gammaproteobacteria bacterium]
MPIDLRSDTVTQPTSGMRAAMAAAEVGEDVYGEDATGNRLEDAAAELLGTESAIFCSSGTQSNLLALLAHCERGDEFIVGQQAHTYQYEGGGAASLGSIQPQPLDFESDGTLDLEKVARAVKPDDVHFARTQLLCLENTQSGRVLPLEYLRKARELTHDRGLRMHLDGARVFNAAEKLQVPVSEICKHFDSTSFCLSKGLGAPIGSLLCGSAVLIGDARRWRKTLGGGMRQAGIIAAAGLYALEHNVERLAEDHENAALLARSLGEIKQLTVDSSSTQTNMVLLGIASANPQALEEHLCQNGILIHGGQRIRLVTHLDVSESDIEKVISVFRNFFSA